MRYYFQWKKVFEAYVAKNLKKRLNQAGWDVSIQDKGYYLFDTLNGEKYQKFALRPDLVITRPDESIIILDTKWKSLINNKKANYGISQAGYVSDVTLCKEISSIRSMAVISNE